MEHINNEVIDLSYENKFTSLLSKYVVPKVVEKPKYEYQELTKKLAPIYGRRIYSLPYERFYSDFKLQKAHEVTEKYCKGNIRYLIKVMRGLPY